MPNISTTIFIHHSFLYFKNIIAKDFNISLSNNLLKPTIVAICTYFSEFRSIRCHLIHWRCGKAGNFNNRKEKRCDELVNLIFKN